MVDVELSSKEYEKIQHWYSLAFAKMAVDKITRADQRLLSKLEIMNEAKLLEEKTEQD